MIKVRRREESIRLRNRTGIEATSQFVKLNIHLELKLDCCISNLKPNLNHSIGPRYHTGQTIEAFVWNCKLHSAVELSNRQTELFSFQQKPPVRARSLFEGIKYWRFKNSLRHTARPRVLCRATVHPLLEQLELFRWTFGASEAQSSKLSDSLRWKVRDFHNGIPKHMAMSDPQMHFYSTEKISLPVLLVTLWTEAGRPCNALKLFKRHANLESSIFVSPDKMDFTFETYKNPDKKRCTRGRCGWTGSPLGHSRLT